MGQPDVDNLIPGGMQRAKYKQKSTSLVFEDESGSVYVLEKMTGDETVVWRGSESVSGLQLPPRASKTGIEKPGAHNI